MDIEEIILELKYYAELEGTEVGEVCELLCALAGYPDYLNNDFYLSLQEEIIKQHANFKENCTVTEKEETFTHTVTDFEWHGGKYQS